MGRSAKSSGKAPAGGYGNPDPAPRAVALFFGLFFAVGFAAAIPTVFLPAFRMIRARSWIQVPCVVESSKVDDIPGDESSTFRIAIRYRYEVGGKPYHSGRYGFMGGTTSGYEKKAAIVARYPPGAEATCWVDPADPEKAVIERGFTPDMLYGLIPIGFMTIGFGGMAIGGGMWRKRKKDFAAAAYSGDAPVAANAAYAVPPGDGGPMRLKEQTTPLARFVFLTLFALVWNGVISFFAVSIFKEWSRGGGFPFFALFLAPFVLIGIGFLFLAVYSFLALFNPRLRATLVPGSVAIGGTARLEWSVVGSASRVKSLSVTLEGTEQATYRRGTTTRTDKSVFCRAVLFETRHPMQIAQGSVDIAIPSPTMHSFNAPSNKIVWTLKVRGEIPRWPDMDGDYEIAVDPLPERGA